MNSFKRQLFWEGGTFLRKLICLFLSVVVFINYLPLEAIATDSSNYDPAEAPLVAPPTTTSLEESRSSSQAEETTEDSTQETTTETSSSSSITDSTTSEASSETTSSSEETVATNEVTPTPDVASEPKTRATGEGTSSNPFLVGTLDELKAAINAPQTGGAPTYIRLIDNITIPSLIQVNKSIVVDGLKNDGDAYEFANYYTVNYTGSGYGFGVFQASSGNIEVTFKNINFGSKASPQSTYYGILHIPAGKPNVVQNMENINYYATNGAQPFCSYSPSSILTISGHNEYYSSGPSPSGEFAEGYGAINFKTGSTTKITQTTAEALTVFWAYGSSAMAVTVEENAQVEIESSKPRLFYDGGSLTVQENGQFRMRYFGSGAKYLNTRGMTMTFGKNSVGEFIVDSTGLFSPNNVIVNADNPDYVIFTRKPTGNQRLINSDSITFRRRDQTADNYQINYVSYDSSQVGNHANGIAYGSSYVMNTGTPTSRARSIIYQRGASINPEASIATGVAEYRPIEAGGSVSQLEMALREKDYTPADRRLQTIEYKILRQRPYSGNDLTTTAAQDAITGALAMAGRSVDVSYDSTGQLIVEPFVLKDLAAGTYYVYARIIDQVEAFGSDSDVKYTTTSPWVERAVNLATFIELVEMPKLDFSNGFGGSRLSVADADQNVLRVASNAYLDVEWLELKRNEMDEIQLLEAISLPNESDTPQLKLAYDVISDYTKTTWNFASSKHEKIRVGPYFESATAGDIKFTLSSESLFSDIDTKRKSLQYLLRLSFNEIKDS